MQLKVKERGRMKEGKIPYDVLGKLIDQYSYSKKSMVIGPGIGVDCSVFDIGKKFLVATCDPVTFVSSGYYCLNVNLNDILSMGARPLFFMATIILPPDNEELESIMEEIYRGCKRYRISFGGGHTEINPIVNRPMISGFMVGICGKDELKGSFNAKDGDRVLITKGIGIEGTAIIAEKKRKEIELTFGKAFLKRALFYKKQLSVYKEAMIARKSANGMHDATEGGVLNALYEMCVASNVSMDIDDFPLSTETKELCNHFSLNPLGLISSGTLIITTKDESLKERIEKKGIRVYDIGVVRKDRDEEGKGKGKREVRYRGKVLKPFDRDEIIKI